MTDVDTSPLPMKVRLHGSRQDDDESLWPAREALRPWLSRLGRNAPSRGPYLLRVSSLRLDDDPMDGQDHEVFGRRRDHICSVCNKPFETRYKLERHERTHTGEKPFVCPFCPHRCNQRDNLKAHVASRHREKIEFYPHVY